MLPKFLYFLHIPKTAGTSFTDFLYRFYPPERVCPARGNITSFGENLEVWGKSIDWQKYSILCGHYNYLIVEYLPKDIEVITVLRNPVERTISFFHHLFNDTFTIQYFKGKIIKNITNGDIHELLKDPDLRALMSNGQTVALGFSDNQNERFIDRNQEEYSFASEKYRSALVGLTDDELEDLLQNAKRHLAKMRYFGIQDYFQQSLLLFYLVFNVPYVELPTPQKMVFPNKKKREEISLELLREYEEINSYDIRLYSYAKDEFVRRYTTYVEQLAQELYEPIPAFEDVAAVKYLLLKKEKVRKLHPILRKGRLVAASIMKKARRALRS